MTPRRGKTLPPVVLDPSSILLKQVPPHSLESEQAVLSFLIARPARALEVLPLLSPECFYSQAHQYIYAAVVALDSLAVTHDSVAVAERLKEAGKLEEAGGVSYLMDLLESPLPSSGAEHHAKQLLTLARRRELARAAGLAIHGAYDVKYPLDFLESQVAALTARSLESSPRRAKSIAEVVGAVEPFLREVQDLNGQLLGVPLPWSTINHITSGLCPGDSTILAGDTGLGKTAMALGILSHAARLGYPGAMFTAEMPGEQLVCRMLASSAKVDGRKFRGAGNPWEEDEITQADMACRRLERLPLHFFDSAPINISDIRNTVRNLVNRHGLRLVVVDYLQRVHPAEWSTDAVERIELVSHALKDIALEFKVSVLTLCQFNRSRQDRQKEPKLQELKGASAIEQDADNIMLIWEPRKFQASNDMKTVHLRMSKVRHGPSGALVELSYHLRHLEFFEIGDGA